HWFLANAISDWLSPLFPLSMLEFPGEVNEGYAQFFSGEPWGFNRGDRYLKTSILSQRMEDPSARYAGGLLYARGFSFVRYLAQEYGEDSLRKLLKFRSEIKLYNFDDACEKVFKKSKEKLWEDWRRHVHTYYYGELYLPKAAAADTTSWAGANDFSPISSRYRDFQQIVWKQDRLLFTAKNTANEGFYTLFTAEVDSAGAKEDELKLKSVSRIATRGSFTALSLSENGRHLAYAVNTRHARGRIAPRVYAWDIDTGRKRNLGEGNYPAVSEEGGIYFQKLEREANCIYYAVPGEEPRLWKTFDPDAQLSLLSLSPDNSLLAYALFAGDRSFRLQILTTSSGDLVYNLHLEQMPQSLLFLSDDKALFTMESSVTASLQIYELSCARGTYRVIASQPYNSFPLKLDGDRAYVLAEFLRGGKSLGSFQIRNQEPASPKYQENYYNRWTRIKPRQEIPEEFPPIELSRIRNYNSLANLKWRAGFALPGTQSITALGVFSEALGKHMLTVMGFIPYDPDLRSWWNIGYLNRSLYPLLYTSLSSYPFLSGYDEDKAYYYNTKQASLSASFPVDIVAPFQSATYGFGFSYNDLEDESNNPEFEDHRYASFYAEAGYAYNLPYRNDFCHKVRALSLDYSLQAATDKLKMNLDYTQHLFSAGFSFAPLLNYVRLEQLRTIALENRSNFEIVYGSQLKQLLPGTTKYESIIMGDRPLFTRYYLRGYEENHISKSLLNLQTDLKFMLVDNLKLGLSLNNPLAAVHYLGCSVFYDYTKLDRILDAPGEILEFQAQGLELRCNLRIMDMDTVWRLGRAYDTKYRKLGDYLLLEIPLVSATL
ncbi:MAG: hypothetical protein PHI68_08900, partial [Candidatus Cloacimonetes bacterium]|nr:hypothetical protein [Candidatus Cloacimonadota bacterium]